jgi:Caspase domain
VQGIVHVAFLPSPFGHLDAYAGHGLQIGRENYLVPIDAKLKRERDLQFEAVGIDFVMRQMEIDSEGKTTIIILDACRDNPLARNLARSVGTRSIAIGRGLAATGLGTLINYATQPGNVALDGEGRNSPFTAALTKHIMSKGRNLNATMIAVRNEVVAAYRFTKSTPATRTRAGAAACAARPAAGAATTVLVPPKLLGQKPSRVDRGFKVFEGASVEGDVIKMAATFIAKKGELGNMCTTYCRVTKAKTGLNGTYAFLRE